MITKDDVERFLKDFYFKVSIYDIRFRDDRDKNRNALLELEISPRMRLEAVMSLKNEDYSAGPITDALNNYGEMWVFGKDVNEVEVYIKISMGKPNSNTICISFHAAEHPMSYPFKNK